MRERAKAVLIEIAEDRTADYTVRVQAATAVLSWSYEMSSDDSTPLDTSEF